ncbi:periplasmic heavy metal sensor [Mariprofundus sp. EBB-1]|uniref:Spy/CpxP family protein refolding chaperone n=1 Tax=Mariprofundus sp. EBB-1 TaxID=2650971 RepID=UPI000EF1F599|nr:Spy/CpxP family protein refolding chaperone [Mariprofundus sp. EBB-1]RLL53316.1 periplasmic heavy metal sensor [Mariprofundus sp. EBB-1]
MTEHTEEKTEQHQHETDRSKKCCKGHHKCRRLGRAIFGILAIVGIVALAGAAFGSSCGYAGWHHGGHHWSEVDSAKQMNRMTERLIEHVDTTPAQEQQIKTITSSYLPQIQTMKGGHLNSRNELTKTLTQEHINRAELENVRQDALSLVNKNSKVVIQMLADIADVLTHEQRLTLAAEFAEFHHSH